MSATGSTQVKVARLLAVAAGAAAGGALAGLAVLFAAHLTLRPPRRPRRLRAVEGLPCEEVEFAALDGTLLRGWFIPAPTPRGVMLLCHGYLMNREALLPHAHFLHQAGYSCLLFDFRAAGESQGDLCSFGHFEAQDVGGALRFLREREETRGLPRAGLGLSMGGVALLLAAEAEPELRAIVADGIFPSLAQAVQRRCRMLFGPLDRLAWPLVSRAMARKLGASPDRVAPIEVAARLSDTPTLFIHSDRDIYLDPEHAEAILDQALEPKALWRVAGAQHCKAIRVDPEGYARQVLAFLSAHGMAEAEENRQLVNLAIGQLESEQLTN